jgi:hypothetical protein
MKRVICWVVGHQWTAWTHVNLPVLRNIQTGAVITKPYDGRECSRCHMKQERW